MHVKCQYCATDCWDVEARNGHEALCDQNPANGKVKGKGTVVVLSDTPTVAPTPDLVLTHARSVVVTGGKYKDKTVGEVETDDYAYLVKYLVASTDPQVMEAAAAIALAHP